ncbi:hypothetical protein M413DRAFT_443388 [Hebeloma cylindrosporum]|uniref:Uncharacterized protein n=1 Tax=Hebeloma cylindrosporum TaxID=76867 RepID=A0A0C3CIK9_HEBCY|nr:hypothetical protein M413DRAFT_443388 [Hebeloma cylindrosporum h7]
MPSSSKKRTAAKKQQQQHQQPSTEIAPLPQNNSIDFETFINLADLEDIVRFCDAVASTQEGKNLKLFWDRAFEGGLNQARMEWGSRDEERKEFYFRGKAKGIKEAEAAARSAEVDLFYHGVEKGRTEERLEWTSAGHGPHCLAPVCVLSDAAVQTDSESSTQTLPAAPSQSSNVDTSTQTSPSFVDVDTQTPVPQDPPSSSPMPTLASSSYKPLTDSISIERLIGLARDSPQDSELGIVWQHALEEGRKAGYAEGAKMVDGMQVSDVLKIGFEKGQVRGIVQERELWEMAGHSTSCFVTATSSTTTADTGTQVDRVTSLPPCTDTLVQTISTGIQTSPRSLVNADSHTSVITEPVPQVSRLDWAEDATSLPIAPLLPTPSVPRQHAPRDFSSLCSSRPNPFGSLQRRSKQSRPPVSSRFPWTIPFTRTLHPRYRPPPLCPPSSFPKPRVPAEASKKEPVIFSNLTPASSHISALDWDQDPRLSDLSRALKALGWIRP